MAKASRQGDSVHGYYTSEHHGHKKRIIVGYDSDGDPIYEWVDMHTGGRLYGEVTGGSSNVYVNNKRATRAGDTTREWDECCNHEGVTRSGYVRDGSSRVYINGKRASRDGDSVNTHNGYGSINGGSSNVFIGG